MPIHSDWQELYQSFIDQHGEDEGKSKFYAHCKAHNIDYTKPKPEAEAKEGFRWLGDVEIADVPKKNLVKFKALHPVRTFHPEEWPNIREYLEEELVRSARTLTDKPLGVDHESKVPDPYRVLASEYEDGAVEGLAYAPDDIVQKIRDGKIEHCSVEFNWRTLENVNGAAPKGIIFTRLDFLEKYEPGDPQTTLEVWEGIINRIKEAKDVKRGKAESQEFILHTVKDPAAFLEEKFSTTWIDPINGIQALMGRPREQPESLRVQSLLFMKASGWTLEKVNTWLQEHPQYSKPKLQATSVMPPIGVIQIIGKEKSEAKRSLGEAVIAPTTEAEPSSGDLIRREEVLALLPERVPRHWGYGPYELVRRIRRKLQSSS